MNIEQATQPASVNYEEQLNSSVNSYGLIMNKSLAAMAICGAVLAFSLPGVIKESHHTQKEIAACEQNYPELNTKACEAQVSDKDKTTLSEITAGGSMILGAILTFNWAGYSMLKRSATDSLVRERARNETNQPK